MERNRRRLPWLAPIFRSSGGKSDNHRPKQGATSLADRKRASQIEVCPNRRVIGRIFAFAHLAIDPGCSTFLRETFTRQNSIDPQAAIFLERKHSIIPPRKNARLV